MPWLTAYRLKSYSLEPDAICKSATGFVLQRKILDLGSLNGGDALTILLAGYDNQGAAEEQFPGG